MKDKAVDLWALDEVHFQQQGSRCRMWVPAEIKDPVVYHHPTRKPPSVAPSFPNGSPKGNAMPVIQPNGVALPTISREDQERCEELLQRWIVALNNYDAAGMKSVMRFPHVRLAENRVAIYQADDNPMDLFTRLRQAPGKEARRREGADQKLNCIH